MCVICCTIWSNMIRCENCIIFVGHTGQFFKQISIISTFSLNVRSCTHNDLSLHTYSYTPEMFFEKYTTSKMWFMSAVTNPIEIDSHLARVVISCHLLDKRKTHRNRIAAGWLCRIKRVRTLFSMAFSLMCWFSVLALGGLHCLSEFQWEKRSYKKQ